MGGGFHLFPLSFLFVIYFIDTQFSKFFGGGSCSLFGILIFFFTD